MTERTPLADAIPPLGALDERGLDAELVALPAPSRTRALGGMALMVTVMLLSLGMMVRMRGDLEYFWLADRAPRDLGRADRVSVGTLVENEFVTLEGMPLAARAVRFQRLGRDGTYRVYPLAGQPKVFVERYTPAGRSTAREEHGRYSGRMIRFRHAAASTRSVQSYLERDLGMPVSDDAWLLVDGERPGDQYWTAALVVVLVFFFGFNAIMLWRFGRPIRSS